MNALPLPNLPKKRKTKRLMTYLPPHSKMENDSLKKKKDC